MSHPLNSPRHPWARLTTAARTVRADADASVPFGFTTRVAALAFAQERRVASLLERFSLRAVGIAALLAVFSVLLNYQAFSETPAATVVQADEVDVTSADDAVAIVLDFAD